MGAITLTLDEASDLGVRAFTRAGASPANARAAAAALVAAQADGQAGHGLSRIPSYAAQVASGKIDGEARPAASRPAPAVVAVDAGGGFAYPALNLVIDELAPVARETGVALGLVRRSHHFGQAGAHVERLAEAGLVGFLFGNSPKAIAFWGSSEPMLGTNPIAFAAPVPNAPPLVIDLALSVAARGKIMAAKKAGRTIPEGWAFDADGNATTDPDAALAGSMVPLGGLDGGAKGAALALMVEVMAAALTGGNYGFEASSFFTPEGPQPGLGQTFLAIDPARFDAAGDGVGPGFAARMATICGAIADRPGARRPGDGRLSARAKARAEGLSIPEALHAEIVALADA
ncbi:MAG: Ldh family oxidoreductase [Pseudomonadota bacterium]